MADPVATSQPSRSPAFRAGASLVITVAAAAALIIVMGDAAYLWIKAFHIIAVIAWMAGMLYLPRLFVYHADTRVGSPQSETFKVMEGRLLNYITTPAMTVTWVLGLWLAWRSGFYAAPWLHAKIALVLALSGLHGYLSAATRRFREDQNTQPARHWRIINEVPTVLMIGIVILVDVKPI